MDKNIDQVLCALGQFGSVSCKTSWLYTPVLPSGTGIHQKFSPSTTVNKTRTYNKKKSLTISFPINARIIMSSDDCRGHYWAETSMVVTHCPCFGVSSKSLSTTIVKDKILSRNKMPK